MKEVLNRGKAVEDIKNIHKTITKGETINIRQRATVLLTALPSISLGATMLFAGETKKGTMLLVSGSILYVANKAHNYIEGKQSEKNQ